MKSNTKKLISDWPELLSKEIESANIEEKQSFLSKISKTVKVTEIKLGIFIIYLKSQNKSREVLAVLKK